MTDAWFDHCKGAPRKLIKFGHACFNKRASAMFADALLTMF